MQTFGEKCLIIQAFKGRYGDEESLHELAGKIERINIISSRLPKGMAITTVLALSTILGAASPIILSEDKITRLFEEIEEIVTTTHQRFLSKNEQSSFKIIQTASAQGSLQADISQEHEDQEPKTETVTVAQNESGTNIDNPEMRYATHWQLPYFTNPMPTHPIPAQHPMYHYPYPYPMFYVPQPNPMYRMQR
jgi:hypothetical protein